MPGLCSLSLIPRTWARRLSERPRSVQDETAATASATFAATSGSKTEGTT
jgi:hypothetical protein